MAGELTNRSATDWLKIQADTPFFAFVHYFDTHQPYDTPAEAPPAFVPDAAFESRLRSLGLWESTIDEVSEKPITLDGRPLGLAQAINTYDNEILRVDGLIGQLLATLDEMGVSDETLVIFTSDHGEGLGQHDYYSHGLHLYEEQVHVPLLVRPPARWGWKPHRVGSVASLLDVFPHGPRPRRRRGHARARWSIAHSRDPRSIARGSRSVAPPAAPAVLEQGAEEPGTTIHLGPAPARGSG